MSMELKNRIKLGMGLLLVIAVGLAVYFGFFAAKAPAEIPDLAEHTGTVTVTHGNALLDARMDETDSAKLIELLAHARFSPNEEAQIQDYSGGIRILFADGGEITLLRGEEKVFARAVNAAGETGYYTVSADVYEQVRLHIYTVFPDGVTFEELQPWWDEYFYIASLTLMDSDFNSAQEIPPESVAKYTLYQMIADGSAEGYLTTGQKGSWYQIPYSEFLGRAQYYFADGANVSLKETRYYREEDKSMLFSTAQLPELTGERPAFDDPAENGGYCLVSVHRDLMGVLTAEVYDYNEVGFTEGGVHTRTHYFTMVCGSDGRYRFVSKRSQIIDPAQVSVEGYFLSIGQIGEITPEIEAEFALTQAGVLDGNILLYHIQHTASGYQMYLYGVNPRTGGVIRSAEIPEQPESSAQLRAEVTADGTGVLVFAEDRVILLDSRLSQVEELVLPEEAQGLEYDCSDDGEQLCYVDDTGLWLLRAEDTEPILLAAHPTQPEGEPEIRLARPRFIQQGSSILTAEIQDGSILYYTRYDLDELEEKLEEQEADRRKNQKKDDEDKEVLTGLLEGRRVSIYPGTVITEVSTDDYLVVLYPNRDTEELTGYIAGTVHYFESDATFSFILPDNAEAGPRLILNDRVYYFEQVSQPGEENVVFELKVLELGSAMNRISTGLKVSNAEPRILGADAEGRVLFSFVSPSGSGMGITDPVRQKGTESN